MEKQHNRGQDGAGVASIKINMPPGSKYISRYRSNATQPILDVMKKINGSVADARKKNPKLLSQPDWLKENVPFIGELYLGHLRYGTFGKNNIDNCHPFLRENNWMTRNLVVAGNFNLTNVDTLFDQLIALGQHPREMSDTITVLEKIGHFLDEENEDLFQRFKAEGKTKAEISPLIAEHLDIQRILTRAAKGWDGGYAIAGLIGHGDAFVLRDPNGIRPAFYYYDDEIAVVTSERPAIQTAFNIPIEKIKEINPGHALIIKKNGNISEAKFIEPREKKSCSFERIYFSRGSDKDIYTERKNLGRALCDDILKAIDYDLKNTVFSFIPNTAEVAFYGMIKGMEDYLKDVKLRKIKKLDNNYSDDQLSEILSMRPRVEKIAIKDAKLRTFITDDAHRDELVAHVYDITYGTIRKGIDNLVVIDDSIVRGTTLKQSILSILDRLGPKKIIIVSSAPQIRYPDCYGIDMAKIGDFVAFKAAISLIEENNLENIIDEVYYKCKEQFENGATEFINYVKKIYEPFTDDQISSRIAEIIKPENINSEVGVIYQTIENLHKAIPSHSGDWYFSGNYPTPGGHKVVCRAFINYIEGRNVRAY